MQTPDEIIKVAKASQQFTLLFPLEEELQVFPLARKGDVFILDKTMSLTGCLDMLRSYADPQTDSALLAFAQKLTARGLLYKNHGNLSDAYLCYRIALFFAFHFEANEGVDAIARNIRILYEQLIDLTVRGNEIRLNVTDENFSVTTRKEYIAALNRDPVALKALKAKLEQSKELVRADAAALLHQLGLENNEQAAQKTFTETRAATAWNLSVAAGYTSLRKGLTKERLTVYEKESDDKKAYWLILEELAVIDVGEFLNESAFQETQLSYFSYVWGKYVTLTQNIKELVHSYPVVSLYESVFRQFEYISSRLTSAGGAFGHLLHYNFSDFFQMIGRDYIAYCLVQQPDELIKAYELAEQIRNRSMINWIGRTVYHSRMPKQASFPLITAFTGSVNAVEPIRAGKMASIPAITGAPVISYLLTPVGLIIWLQTITGELYSYLADWGKIKQLLNSYLPADGTDVTLKPPDTNFFNNTMADLYAELFPAKLREKLDQPDTKRIILVTDHELDYLPFCALLTPSNEYLIEKYEISYLSSLTAFYIQENQPAATAVPSLGAWQPPLLMGLSEFSDLRKKTGLPFKDLEGTKEELITLSALLDAPYFLDSGANYENLYGRGIHCRILHIASHAWFDMENPSESFFVLHDGIVKADEIYRFDPGFRNGLVVLSACQTGLGRVAPDAGFSLSNAFMVAGARSVISSLWQVPDKATRQLMEQLYTGLCESLSIPSSLRQAQLRLIGSKEYMHPLNWAGFKSAGLLKNPSDYG
jgi:CHAT domain-containing protein